MGVAARKHYTSSDFLKFPDDGNRHEVINGEWIRTPPPSLDHQRVVGMLYATLRSHAADRGLGEAFVAPVGVLLSPTDAIQPDVVFVSEKRAKLKKKDAIHGAPDLMVEVLSPSTTSVDRTRKLTLYEKSGVREYWIVDPASRTVEIHEFGGARRLRVHQEGQSFESAVLPGLSLAVSAIFSSLR
ncbi:MAG TPA: Uma2 family endonuclease [Planctomycetota bacterium]|nr:Uma2 family endonuclease [Planctomycetota bacterium]